MTSKDEQVDTPSKQPGPPIAATIEELYTSRPHSRVFYWTPGYRGGTLAAHGIARSGQEPIPTPDLKMFCEGACGHETQHVGWPTRSMLVDSHAVDSVAANAVEKALTLVYVCANCRQATVIIPLRMELRKVVETQREYTVTKIGMDPPGLPAVPKAVSRFLNGSVEWEMYSKGRRSEAQGLGIGAFAYYRRIVENQWRKLLERLVVASRKLGYAELADELEQTKDNWQFSSAVEQLKPGIPDRLQIQGRNPLLLLHGVISSGIHGGDDSECLADAAAVRTILEQLLARMKEINEEEGAVSVAIQRLTQQRKGPD